MCLRVSYKTKYEKKKIIFYILKVTKERRSWIRIWIHESEVQIRGSGYTPKCHGSVTLVAKIYEKKIPIGTTSLTCDFSSTCWKGGCP
jgi:hypothetical protein